MGDASVAFVLVAVALAVRACTFGVTVRGDDVIVRNIEWSYRGSRTEVSAVRVVSYDGRPGGTPWNSWWWTTLELTLVGDGFVEPLMFRSSRTRYVEVLRRLLAEYSALAGKAR